MKKHLFKKAMAMVLAAGMTLSVAACGGGGANLNTGEMQEVDAESLKFPLAETATIKGLISYPANTESNPNNRTIFKRLEEKTNVHVEWDAIQSDQWGDKISLAMANPKTLADF